MRVLVTGGAGFIGSHLVDQLIARGDTVCVLDHLSTGRIENIRHHLGRPGFTLVNDTILNADVVNRARRGGGSRLSPGRGSRGAVHRRRSA